MAVGEVDGVAVGHEVFVCAITLYGKACVQYVVNGGGVVAFVTGCQGSTIVTARIAGGIARIGQVALHVGQCGRCSGIAGCILHAGNHIAGSHFGTTAVRLGVEVAVGVFVHFVAVGIGVYHWGLGVLHDSLGIQCVGVGLVTVGSVHFLFHSQTVTCSKGYFLAWFNGSGSGSSTAGQSTTGSSLEAAVVDGIGNVTCSGQFISISASRSNHLASGIAASTIAHVQRSGISCYRVSRAAGSCIHVRGNANTIAGGYLAGSGSLRCFQLVLSRTASAGDVVRIPSFVGQSGYGTGIAVNLNRVTAGGRAYGDAVGQFEAHLVVGYGGDDVAVTFVGNGLSQLNSIGSRAVTDLEAVFFQVVQLAAVDGFFAACGNVAVRNVT